jgi:hypothetical protein
VEWELEGKVSEGKANRERKSAMYRRSEILQLDVSINQPLGSVKGTSLFALIPRRHVQSLVSRITRVADLSVELG